MSEERMGDSAEPAAEEREQPEGVEQRHEDLEPGEKAAEVKGGAGRYGG